MILKRQGNSRAWPVHQAYFPYKTHPSKRGNSMAWPVQRIHFWHTCHPTPMPNYSSEVLILLLRQCHTKTIQAEPQTDGHQTKQQHGQAGSTKPFLDRVSPTLDAKRCACRETAWPDRFNGPIFDMHFTPPRCQTSHLNPTKKTNVLACIALHPLATISHKNHQILTPIR